MKGSLMFLFASLSMAVWSAESQPLGRLFFTPEQRAEIDRQRGNHGDTDRLTGIVRRSNGHDTYWINGTAVQTTPIRLPAWKKPSTDGEITIHRSGSTGK